ncbi:MAG: hypothetical protein RJQ09_00690 [Cyclobacteriaceae bacterium]
MKHLFLALSLLSGFSSFSQSAFELFDLKVNHHATLRNEIQTFYKDVLKCELVTPDSNVPRDYVQFSNDQRLNIIYFDDDNQILSDDDFMNSIWIKIKVDEFVKRREAVLGSGVKIIADKPDKGELYFQAPGGQVYRMVDVNNT